MIYPPLAHYILPEMNSSLASTQEQSKDKPTNQQYGNITPCSVHVLKYIGTVGTWHIPALQVETGYTGRKVSLNCQKLGQSAIFGL